MAQQAVVVGATGVVGRTLVDMLVDGDVYDEVSVLVRRPFPRRAPRLRHRVVDFDRFLSTEVPESAAAAFCCLGTTIARAGSEEAFRRVDKDYVLAFARACRERGVRSLHVVSAMGADPHSHVFYNRVKGEMEDALRGMGLASTHVYRPSLLLADREESRPAERAAVMLGRLTEPLWRGPLLAWRPVPPELVARAMANVAADPKPGFHVHRSNALWTLARE